MNWRIYDKFLVITKVKLENPQIFNFAYYAFEMGYVGQIFNGQVKGCLERGWNASMRLIIKQVRLILNWWYNIKGDEKYIKIHNLQSRWGKKSDPAIIRIKAFTPISRREAFSGWITWNNDWCWRGWKRAILFSSSRSSLERSFLFSFRFEHWRKFFPTKKNSCNWDGKSRTGEMEISREDK